MERVSQNEDLKFDTAVSNDYWYLATNQKREPFGDPRVRRAIAYGIDRKAIVQATHVRQRDREPAGHTEDQPLAHRVLALFAQPAAGRRAARGGRRA